MATIPITIILAQLLLVAMWIAGLREMAREFGDELAPKIVRDARRGILIVALLAILAWFAFGLFWFAPDARPMVVVAVALVWFFCFAVSLKVSIYYLAKGQFVVILFPLKEMIYGTAKAKNQAKSEWIGWEAQE